MTEILQPLPLEEQLKQDSRFSYILELNPSALDILIDLRKAQSANPEDKHSRFWLDYLSMYNLYAKTIREVLMEDAVSDEEISVHEESLKEAINEEIGSAISDSNKPGFFDEREDPVGDFIRTGVVVPFSYVEFMKYINDDLILDHEGILLEIPPSISQFAQATSQIV